MLTHLVDTTAQLDQHIHDAPGRVGAAGGPGGDAR